MINRSETVEGVKLAKSDSGLYFEIGLRNSLGPDTISSKTKKERQRPTRK